MKRPTFAFVKFVFAVRNEQPRFIEGRNVKVFFYAVVGRQKLNPCRLLQLGAQLPSY
jgi:hypothetical protein